MRKILRVLTKEEVEELMDICEPWSSSDVIDIQVKGFTSIYRDDEVVLVNSNGMIVSPKKFGRNRLESLSKEGE